MGSIGMVRGLKRLAKPVESIGRTAARQAGYHVLRNHYYAPIADVDELKRTRNQWAHRQPMRGIDTCIDPQIATLRRMVKPFEPEYRNNTAFREASMRGFGPGYGYIEGQCFHGMLRALKPRMVIEVGSGVSTYCALKALERNAQEGAPGRVHAIEPHPSAFLIDAADRSRIRLTRSTVQTVDPGLFQELGGGDLLFIDSSHAVKPGGDLFYLYLEVLPSLKPGVVIHIHDIYFPYLYQRDLMRARFQWSETALLLALMTSNPHLAILVCLSQLHYDAPEALREVFPEYTQQAAIDGLTQPGAPGHFPSSLYLRTA
jgi:predicted O-methyltransferase YrrM